MKGIISTVLLVTLLPTLAMAAGTCELNGTSEKCQSYNGCYFYAITPACKPCGTGMYNNDSLDSPDECKSCKNTIPDGADQTDFTTENCPWILTCSAGKYYDTQQKQCTPCPDNQYASDSSDIISNGTEIIQGRITCTLCPDNSHANEDHNDCVCDNGYDQSDNECIKKCTKNQYRNGDKCTDCPTGSTTSGNDATSINECYMDSTTKFYTADGREITFEKVFGDNVTISYDATDE